MNKIMNIVKSGIIEIKQSEIIELMRYFYDSPFELLGYFFSATWWAVCTADVPFNAKLFYFYDHHIDAESKGYRIVIYDGSVLRVRRSTVSDTHLNMPIFVVVSQYN